MCRLFEMVAFHSVSFCLGYCIRIAMLCNAIFVFDLLQQKHYYVKFLLMATCGELKGDSGSFSMCGGGSGRFIVLENQ